ncbi:hypothetical protein PZB74_08290 [Porifericola rhodea]|uniref:hypothetical protein n=1 Tax=Porifericola rhodea TaxID=930972 RepID=UPI0026664C19|nr:hypothetical protein [Porifericola rhodea]WKN33332.1 hypothetical protein PZB74_08290 [Porifericola rhodea]
MQRIVLTLALYIFFSFSTFAQKNILDDKELLPLIKQSLSYIYNTDVVQANQVNQKIEQKIPDHPAYFLLKALTIRAANTPVTHHTPEFEDLKNYLQKTYAEAEKILDKDDMHPEANFFAMASLGLLAMYENDEGNHLKAVGLAQEAYTNLKNGFELKEEYPEFYFSTGLYNYYRIKYPELHPVYRPFMLFFRSGDKQLGLEQLKKAHQESIFMGPESADYLTHIYLRYENRPKEALQYAQSLAAQYPDNLYFITNYLDVAISAKQYYQLDQQLQKLLNSKREYYQMTGNLFKALLLEKKEQDFSAAKIAYRASLALAKNMDNEEAENYTSYAYAGLARIANQEKDYDQARAMYKKALDNAHYPPMQAEAKAYLDKH